jgi:hypothetical protein
MLDYKQQFVYPEQTQAQFARQRKERIPTTHTETATYFDILLFLYVVRVVKF